MTSDNLKKSLGGVTVMVSVFLLLFVLKEVNRQGTDVLTNLTAFHRPSTQALNHSVSLPTSSPTEQVVSGKINLNDSSNEVINTFTKDGQTKIFHFRVIRSERIKHQKNAQLTLKMKVLEKEQARWETIPITQIDHAQGLVYFLYEITTNKPINQVILPPKHYTGEYQLIFN